MNARAKIPQNIALEFGLAFARAGIRVFPCRKNDKSPLVKWQAEASADEAKIRAWAKQYPACNWATSPDWQGLGVVDLDGPKGIASWTSLCTGHQAPPTRTTLTPSGGQHLWFIGSLPPSQKRLGAGIDTRGVGSYVLLPGSHVIVPPGEKPDFPDGYEGDYQWANDCDYADLPEWIPVAFARTERNASTAKGEPVSIEHLKTLAPHCSKRDMSRDEWRNFVAAVRNCNVPHDEDESARLDFAIRFSRGEFDPNGVPPGNYTDDDAVAEVFWTMPPREDGVGYGTIFHMARQGGFAGRSAFPIETAQEAFGPAIERLNAPQDSEHSPGAIVLRSEAVQNARKPPSWLIEGFLPDIGTAALHAPFNSFKSFTATDALMSAVSGLPCFGKLPVKRPGPAVYITGEGLSGFETLRRPAWRIARGIPADHELPIFTVDGVPQVRSEGEIARYLEAIATLKQRPSLIVIDPVARAMVGLKENDASDAAVYLNCVERLARTFRCCVLSVLHEGKDATRDIRGSSAFAAGFDAVWKQEADTDALTATIRPIKLKDDAGVDPLSIKARQITVPGTGKGSLVFDLVPASEVRSASKGGVQRSEIGRALQALGAIAGRTISTRVLAHEIAGPDADENVIAAKEKNLRRYAKDRFRAYVAHLGEGGRDATLWTFPRTEDEERGNV